MVLETGQECAKSYQAKVVRGMGRKLIQRVCFWPACDDRALDPLVHQEADPDGAYRLIAAIFYPT